MSKEPNGQLFRRWQEDIPNDGLLRYLDIFNTETLVPVGSKALAEVLVQKTYEFTKPPQLLAVLAKVFGIGVFLAEGDEHRVSRSLAFENFKTLISFARNNGEILTLLSPSGM